MTSHHPFQPRRWRYAAHRAAYVAWRVLVHEAVLWHGAIAVALALAGAVAIVLRYRDGVSSALYLAPLYAAGLYFLVLVSVRFRRTWKQFPALRKGVRWRRFFELHTGGFRRKQFERLTFVRVRVPVFAMAYLVPSACLVAAEYASGRRVPEWIAFAIILGLAAVTYFVQKRLTAQNERDRPKDLERFCPHCGYDLSGSADRCPECGLRRVVPGEPADDSEDPS